MPGDREAATLGELIADLAGRGVRLRVEGTALRCTAPAGVLTPELQTRIRTRKPELVRWLDDQALPPVADRAGPIPLAPTQEQIWLAAHLNPDATAHNIPLAARVAGPLSPAALTTALGEVVRRHEILRTAFPVRHGRPEQRVLSHRPPQLPLVDLSGLPEPLRAAVASRSADAEARRAFDLAADPAFRATLLRCRPAAHRLLLTRHHIATDGWSFGVLATELAAHYTAAVTGAPGTLAAPRRQFADVAAWQRATAEAPELANRVEDWVERLAGASFGLDLGPGRGEVEADPMSSPPAATVEHHLAPGLPESVRRLAGTLRTTPFTVLLAAVGLAVGEWVGRRRVVVGVATAGRTRPEFDTMIGCFAAALPVPLGADPSAPFARTVADTQDALTSAIAAQDTPMDLVAARLRSRRRLAGRTALFDVAFAFQNTPEPEFGLPDLGVRLDPPAPVPAKYPLLLTVAAATDHRIAAEYDTAVVRGDAVRGLLERVQVILASAVADPHRPPTSAAGARGPGPDPAPVGTGRTAGRLAVGAAAGRGDAVAVADRTVQLTVRALYRRASALADGLRAAGVGLETPVGVCVRHTVHLPVALLAVAFAGGYAVPVDPEDPPARQEVALTGSGASVILIGTDQGARFSWFTGSVLFVDRGPTREPSAVAAAAHPDAVAYAVHTSGTTGVPRAVAVTHRNLAALFAATLDRFGLGRQDTWTAVHSSAFDFSVWEIWGCLLCGGRLVVVPRETARDPARWADVLLEEQVTVLSATPGAFEPLAAALLDRGGPAALRLVVLGGERLDPGRLQAWFDACGCGPPLTVNMYGITETTVHVTARVIVPDDVSAPTSPIGSALAGMALHVVDPRGTPSGTGELLVGGAGVTRGYLGSPGATADRFRPDHLGTSPGVRLYRSGDTGRVLPDGGIAYQGRGDAQLSVRGHRVEPAEVEAVLAGHPDIVAAAVGSAASADRARLIGYLVPRPGAAPSLRDVCRYLSGWLPPYLVPHRLLVVDRLPLTRNGKVDRAALPALAERAAPLATRHDPPRSATEWALAALWCELLGLTEVGIHEDFFECGGDSLLVTRLHARVSAQFAVELPMRRLYRALDVAAQAAVIDALRRQTPATASGA